MPKFPTTGAQTMWNISVDEKFIGITLWKPTVVFHDSYIAKVWSFHSNSLHPSSPKKCTHLAEMKHGTCAMTYKYPEETKEAEVRRPKGWFWWSVHTGTAVACVFCWETFQCLTKSLVWGLTHEKPSQALQLSREVVEVYLTCMPLHVKIMNRRATYILSWKVCASFLHVQCTSRLDQANG